ncbi:MAG: hypothetical protein ACRETB_10895, partial [Steroidobacteraceae bacterium]
GLQTDARRLEDGAAATRALRGKRDELRAPLRDQARELMETSVTGLDSKDMVALDAAQRSLAAAAGRFKQLAALLVPLGEQGLVLADTESALTEWTQSIRASQAKIAGYRGGRRAAIPRRATARAAPFRDVEHGAALRPAVEMPA